MFGNEKIQEQMGKYEKEIKSLKEEVKEFKERADKNAKTLKEISSHLIVLSEGQNNLLSASEKATNNIEEKSESFDRIIRKLDQTNLQMEQKTFSRITTVMDEEISKIRTDVARYNSLKDEISGITKNLELLKTQMNNFNILASKIKETDFELVNYADRIEKIERQNSNLERENEHLKDIMAKMAKNRGDYKPRFNHNGNHNNRNNLHHNSAPHSAQHNPTQHSSAHQASAPNNTQHTAATHNAPHHATQPDNADSDEGK